MTLVSLKYKSTSSNTNNFILPYPYYNVRWVKYLVNYNYGFLLLWLKNLYNMNEYKCLPDHTLIQFKYAKSNYEYSFPMYFSIFKISEVFPHPVFPCKHNGALSPILKADKN